MTELRERLACIKQLAADGCECGSHSCSHWRKEMDWLVQTTELLLAMGGASLRLTAREAGQDFVRRVVEGIREESS